VNGQVVSVGAFLSSDRGLSFRAVLEPDIQPRPYSPVEAVVYQKTSTTASCP
jgi:hypothetical protein